MFRFDALGLWLQARRPFWRPTDDDLEVTAFAATDPYAWVGARRTLLLGTNGGVRRVWVGPRPPQ